MTHLRKYATWRYYAGDAWDQRSTKQASSFHRTLTRDKAPIRRRPFLELGMVRGGIGIKGRSGTLIRDFRIDDV